MRTIIAGSRGIEDYDLVQRAMSEAMLMEGFSPSVILSGRARGVDRLGEQWAAANDVPVEPYPADWEKLPRLAGRERNIRMARRADALVAIWDGFSPGTAHMIRTARNFKLKVFVRRVTSTT